MKTYTINDTTATYYKKGSFYYVGFWTSCEFTISKICPIQFSDLKFKTVKAIKSFAEDFDCTNFSNDYASNQMIERTNKMK